MKTYLRSRLAAALLALWPAMGMAATLDDLSLRLTEVRQDIKALDERLVRLEAQMRSQGLISLLNQINELKSEVARLRGSNDELAHAVETTGERQKVFYTDLDARFKGLDNQLKELAAAPPPAPPVALARVNQAAAKPAAPVDAEAEGRAYEAALAHFRAGEYPQALTTFQGFLKDFPDGALASNAHYWIGLAHATQGDYKNAAGAYQKLLQDFPDSNKVPDATLSLARARLQLGEMEAARVLLDKVVAQYSGTRAAENARKLLSTLK